MSQAADEIARLEHELAVLTAKYALIERNARWIKLTSQLTVIPLAALVTYAFWVDLAVGAFCLVLFVGVVVAFWFASPHIRWIDIAAPPMVYFAPSEADTVRQWIADRQARLAQLRSAEQSGHHPA